MFPSLIIVNINELGRNEIIMTKIIKLSSGPTEMDMVLYMV